MNQIKQSSKSGGYTVAADEDGVVEGEVEHVVRSNDNNVGDLTCGKLETTMGPSSNIVNTATIESAVMVEDGATVKDKTDASLDVKDVIVDANPDIEPSNDDYYGGTDANEEQLLISENDVALPSLSVEDVVATSDPDDYMSDTTRGYNLSSVDPHVNSDVKADHIHDAIYPLGKDEDVPVENDEETAYIPVNVDGMMEEVPEDQRPTRRRYIFMLAACIVALAIAAAVTVTSIGRDGTKESLSSSSSTSSTTTAATTITEGDKGADDMTSSLIPNLSGNTKEPSSTQPSFDPSTQPSSQYQWLQLAIDNYVDKVQKATSPPSLKSESTRITLDPSSKPTTQPPSTARPTTWPTSKPTTATPTTRPTMHPTKAPSPGPTNLPTPGPSHSPTTFPTTAAPTANPSKAPSPDPTNLPTPGPSHSPTANPSKAPSPNPTPRPTTATPSMKPLNIVELSIDEAIRPTAPQRKGCITNSIYDEIDRDIEQLKNGISDDKTKSHFLGGIVRQVSQFFVDFVV